MKKQLKLFVWENVLTDYTDGMICILAEDLEQAFELLYKRDSIAWSQMQGIWDRLCWDSEELKGLNKKYPDEDLCQIQKRYLDSEGIKVWDGHIKPEIVTKPKAFTVHGGG